MRTTLTIDDDVLAVARKMAKTERRSLGTVISSLVRQTLRSTAAGRETRNGVPLLAVCPGVQIVTPEMVGQFEQDLL